MNEHFAGRLEDKDMDGPMQKFLCMDLRPRHLTNDPVLFIDDIKEFFIHAVSLWCFDRHRHHDGC